MKLHLCYYSCMGTTTKFSKMNREQMTAYWKSTFVPLGDMMTWTDAQFDDLEAWDAVWQAKYADK